MFSKATWIFLGFLIGVCATFWVIKERAHWLASLEFELNRPHVPPSILESVRNAESSSYRDRSILRRAAEEAQDILVFASPEMAYKMNFSVGRYRIKAQTIEKILPWAIEQKYVVLENTTLRQFAHAIAYFSEQPSLNDWEAATYLTWIKKEHPLMADLTWAEIAENPMLVAKLYSGYMGAGGEWELWRENLIPGAVAKHRLGLS